MALEDYSWADRMVHRMAFSAKAPQRMLREMEDSRFGETIAAQSITAPIFITALPRAGTTLLLELLAKHPDVVTHTYRDMPFVLSPVIWRQFSGRFHAKQDAKERSHGDGIMVSADSPEAFEEVFWLNHCAEDFSGGAIALRETMTAPTKTAMRQHMRALMLSRGASNARYASKNNANIARLPALAQAFPDAHIIVPLRNPLDQAQSLLHQHTKALASHSASAFAARYPRDIGHFEFGADHRPIMFPGMEQVRADHSPDTLDYWLAYWIAAMRHAKESRSARFVDMTGFTHDPQGVLALYHLLGLEAAPEASAVAQAMVKAIRSYDTPVESTLADEALGLFEKLGGTMAGSLSA
ncbi:sulfotransferase [Aurantiacibacter sp. D1-12]|uniref:sulfotransferase n=1 Tax=Aurantiacibacter sp. D1-12 TaxID=2993658 RepID=UPI00237CD5A4|nr:sulfotransferase [Aurantiacibacter sp. D1-12]MDE1467571.1 sulfotransferase [Aurantiacibacter sp. D1-12]